GIEDDFQHATLDTGLSEQLLEWEACPLAVADVRAAHLVADALQRRDVFRRRSRTNLIVAIGLWVIDQSLDAELPAPGGDRRVDEVLRYDVEVVDRRER